MKSQTKIKLRSKGKTNPELEEIIKLARKSSGWTEVAFKLSGSTKSQSSLNLYQIDSQTNEGDTVVILGKVLSAGELTKKIKIVALGISETAREKLKESKSEFINLLEELRKNPKAEGVKILQWKNL